MRILKVKDSTEKQTSQNLSGLQIAHIKFWFNTLFTLGTVHAKRSCTMQMVKRIVCHNPETELSL